MAEKTEVVMEHLSTTLKHPETAAYTRSSNVGLHIVYNTPFFLLAEQLLRASTPLYAITPMSRQTLQQKKSKQREKRCARYEEKSGPKWRFEVYRLRRQNGNNDY